MTLFGKTRNVKEEYLDLSHYKEENAEKEPHTYIKVAEIQKYEDLTPLLDYVYKGSILLLDYSLIKREEIEEEKVINELKKVVRDVKGDIAGLGSTIMIVAPSGVKIDRKKIRGTFF
jgi:SepF-like predicted cell division protein (DUF552 family)